MPITQTARAREFIQLLRERVPDNTMSHCVFTAEFMAAYADEAGITNDQAVTAGLLHDLGKGLDNASLLAAAQEYGIVLNEIQRRRPALLHGPVAAEECRRSLRINDEAIYEAIYWHTTGRPGLGAVGLALYLADYAEPLRTYPEAVKARALLRGQGFRKALRFVVEQKWEYLRTRPHVDPITEAFHAWLETVPD
jgi:predicted HD superfamily hydrolase involved in NAD metabolism